MKYLERREVIFLVFMLVCLLLQLYFGIVFIPKVRDFLPEKIEIRLK